MQMSLGLLGLVRVVDYRPSLIMRQEGLRAWGRRLYKTILACPSDRGRWRLMRILIDDRFVLCRLVASIGRDDL